MWKTNQDTHRTQEQKVSQELYKQIRLTFPPMHPLTFWSNCFYEKPPQGHSCPPALLLVPQYSEIHTHTETCNTIELHEAHTKLRQLKVTLLERYRGRKIHLNPEADKSKTKERKGGWHLLADRVKKRSICGVGEREVHFFFLRLDVPLTLPLVGFQEIT